MNHEHLFITLFMCLVPKLLFLFVQQWRDPERSGVECPYNNWTGFGWFFPGNPRDGSCSLIPHLHAILPICAMGCGGHPHTGMAHRFTTGQPFLWNGWSKSYVVCWNNLWAMSPWVCLFPVPSLLHWLVLSGRSISGIWSVRTLRPVCSDPCSIHQGPDRNTMSYPDLSRVEYDHILRH